MKPKVLVTRPLLPEAMAFLEDHVEVELGGEGREPEKRDIMARASGKQGMISLLVDRIDAEVMDSAPELRIIANCAVGYNNIDLEAARARGIMVTNTPGVLTDTTADLTWALILSVARRIPESDRYTRAGRYMGWELDLMLGQEITGRRLGIVGMGRIGRAVAKRASAFRMRVAYADPHALPRESEGRLGAKRMDLEKLLAESDVVSLHPTLTPETRHMIDRERLRLMKPNAILINVSRGPVVNEADLADALEGGWIWGAGLDVFEREPEIEKRLLPLDNVVLLPHVGSATHRTRLRMSMMAARNLVQALSGEVPENLV